MSTPALSHSEQPPHLTHDELVAAQAETLATPRRHYGALARILFVAFDVLYGKQRTISKLKVLELVARVPYQAWEQVAYIAITHVHNRTEFTRRIFERVRESREQQDNEQWHLLILEELITRSGKRENRIYYFWIPQVIALIYYQISWLLFVTKPRWSYRLNADFEDHAEHEYMTLVAEHPEWESIAYQSSLTAPYGSFDSQADLFRQIGHDERWHKQSSLERMQESRFQ